MDVKKILEKAKEKKWIVLAVAILVLILLLLLLLRSCGGNGGGDNNTDGGSSSISTTTATNPITEEIGYDDELVATWYKDDMAMVLSENGNGSLYYGDEDGGEIQWYTAGNRLSLTTAEKASVVTYTISGNDLILTYNDGTVETWLR